MSEVNEAPDPRPLSPDAAGATITTMRAWMHAATPDEQDVLAERAGTSRGYLYSLAGGHRTASADLGSAIERETRGMHKQSKGRLPRVYRTDLVPACRACEYALKCLGPIAVASEFPIVTQRVERED